MVPSRSNTAKISPLLWIQQYASPILCHYIIDHTDETLQNYLYELLISDTCGTTTAADDNDDDNDYTVEMITSLLLGHLDGEQDELDIQENELRDAVQHLLRAVNAENRHNDDDRPRDDQNTGVNQSIVGGSPMMESRQRTIEEAEALDRPSQQPQQENERQQQNIPQEKKDDLVMLTSSSPSSSPQSSSKHNNRTDRKVSRRQQKQLQKQQQPQQKQVSFHAKDSNPEDDDNDDHAGIGARGTNYHSNSINSNIHIPKVSLLMENGYELLQDATMDIQRGHRYGLLGRNGVGKTTLLKKLASYQIPGLPKDIRIFYVQQQVEYKTYSSDDDNTNVILTTLQSLIASDTYRTKLLKEQLDIEEQLDNPDQNVDDTIIAKLSERLQDVIIELDVIDSDQIENRAVDILKGLQFTDTMIHSSVSYLSGGWRMRLSLAQALIRIRSIDILLLDECSNHLDLYGLDWLIHYLTNDVPTNVTLIMVSHDRSFLDAVCTDIVVLAHHTLSYHVGNYSEYERQKYEKSVRDSQILDAASRQLKKAQEFIQQHSSSSSTSDPNKQRQAKMIKEKKIDRIGNYREDGKRYKQYSLKTLDEKSIRRAQKVEVDIEEPILAMHFPNPVWPSSSSSSLPIMRLEDVSFSYSNTNLTSTNENKDIVANKKSSPTSVKKKKSSSSPCLLNHVTLHLNRGSKVALVGKNGTGKSTLCKLISGELTKNNTKQFHLNGEIWIHPIIRVGYVTQYTIEELEQKYGDMTVIQYAELMGLRSRKESSTANGNTNNVRQYLGAFGLGNTRLANSPIQRLSGGEKMRLSFATIFSKEPHLLLLDESTNHCDIETQQSMATALHNYTGSVLMVSHNQVFLSSFCEELWILHEDGQVTTIHNDMESFDEIFAKYRRSLYQQHYSTTSTFRQDQADRAKKATQNKNASNKQITGFI